MLGDMTKLRYNIFYPVNKKLRNAKLQWIQKQWE